MSACCLASHTGRRENIHVARLSDGVGSSRNACDGARDERVPLWAGIRGRGGAGGEGWSHSA
eukprot:858335-Pleurochrysis_carterae.AAC.1